MSYNINHTEYLSGNLQIKRSDAKAFLEDRKDDVCEGNFLGELNLPSKADPDEFLAIEHPWWYGEGSGNSFDVFKEALALTKGTAEILLVWEGGDSQTGLSVKNGQVKEMKVAHSLKE